MVEFTAISRIITVIGIKIGSFCIIEIVNFEIILIYLCLAVKICPKNNCFYAKILINIRLPFCIKVKVSREVATYISKVFLTSKSSTKSSFALFWNKTSWTKALKFYFGHFRNQLKNFVTLFHLPDLFSHKHKSLACYTKDTIVKKSGRSWYYQDWQFPLPKSTRCCPLSLSLSVHISFVLTRPGGLRWWSR